MHIYTVFIQIGAPWALIKLWTFHWEERLLEVDADLRWAFIQQKTRKKTVVTSCQVFTVFMGGGDEEGGGAGAVVRCWAFLQGERGLFEVGRFFEVGCLLEQESWRGRGW